MNLINKEQFIKKFEVASEKADSLTTKTYELGGIRGAKTVAVNFSMTKVEDDYLALREIDIVDSTSKMPRHGARYNKAIAQIVAFLLREFSVAYFDEENFYIGGSWTQHDDFIYEFGEIRPFIDKDDLKVIAAIFDNVDDETEKDMSEARTIFYHHAKQNKIYRENRMLDTDVFETDKMGNNLPLVFNKIHYTKENEAIEMVCDLNKDDFDTCIVTYQGTIKMDYARSPWYASQSLNQLAEENPKVLAESLIKGKPNDRFIEKVRGGIGVYMEIYDEIARGKVRKDFEVGDWVTYENQLARILTADHQKRLYSLMLYGSYDHISAYGNSPIKMEVSDTALKLTKGPVATEERLVKVDLRPKLNFIGFGYLIEQHDDVFKIRLISKFSDPKRITKALVSHATKRDYYFVQEINDMFFGGMNVVYAKKDQVTVIDDNESKKVTKYLNGKINAAEEAFYSLFKLGSVNISADYFLMELMKYSTALPWFEMVGDISKALNEKEGQKRLENMEELLSTLEHKKKIQKLKATK